MMAAARSGERMCDFARAVCACRGLGAPQDREVGAGLPGCLEYGRERLVVAAHLVGDVGVGAPGRLQAANDVEVPHEQAAPLDEGQAVKTTPPCSSIFWSWRRLLKRVSNRDSFHGSSTERSVSVKVGTHLMFGIVMSRRLPVES